MKEIIIDPITRLEGHGNVSIFLNDKGEVENAYLKIPELRGFEKFCIGRRAELMPQLTTRICGVCPVAHHFAAVKALDAAFNVEPPSAAKKLRELMYSGYYHLRPHTALLLPRRTRLHSWTRRTARKTQHTRRHRESRYASCKRSHKTQSIRTKNN